MKLIDYLLKETKGPERDFILEYSNAIASTTYDVIENTEAPFEKTESFLKFALNILDGEDLPKGKERTKYFTWTKYIIDTTRLISHSWYQQMHDDEIDDMKNKSDGYLRVYTSELSYDDIEKMSQEELWNLVNIAIENAVILSSFLNDYNKYRIWGKTSEFGYSDENPSETKEEKPIKDDTVDISGKFMKHPNLYENLKRISKSN